MRSWDPRVFARRLPQAEIIHGQHSKWEERHKKRCRDVQRHTQLQKVHPEKLAAAMRPYWWAESGCRPSIFSLQSQAKFEAAMGIKSTKCCEPSELDAGPLEGNQPDANSSIHRQAKQFLAMKAGSDIVVPIYNFSVPHAAAREERCCCISRPGKLLRAIRIQIEFRLN